MTRSMVILVGGALVTAFHPVPHGEAATAAAADVGDKEHLKRGNALKRKAEEHQAIGAHAEAARAYAEAFDAFAQRAKPDAKETRMVSLAVDEFGLAQLDAPENVELHEEEVALLDRFAERNGGLPEEFVAERSRVKDRIHVLKAEQAEAKPREEDVVRQSEPKPGALDGRSRHQARAILATGVVGIVGGAALVGAGVWTFGAADERRDAQLSVLDAGEYPDEAGIVEDLHQWHRRGRGIATGFVVSGAVLAAVGLGLASWGIVKLRRAGKGASVRATLVLPMVGSDGVGTVARVMF